MGHNIDFSKKNHEKKDNVEESQVYSKKDTYSDSDTSFDYAMLNKKKKATYQNKKTEKPMESKTLEETTDSSSKKLNKRGRKRKEALIREIMDSGEEDNIGTRTVLEDELKMKSSYNKSETNEDKER